VEIAWIIVAMAWQTRAAANLTATPSVANCALTGHGPQTHSGIVSIA
jgi:hypothetical protein